VGLCELAPELSRRRLYRPSKLDVDVKILGQMATDVNCFGATIAQSPVHLSHLYHCTSELKVAAIDPVASGCRAGSTK
jgi:hypothetical protein